GEETRIHLLDEHNRLWRQTLPERAETALARLQHFFEASLRGAAHRPEDAVRYYQLLPGTPATATEAVRRLPPRAEPGALPLRAQVHRDARGREWITLCAGRTAFAERTLGGGLYAAVVGWWRAQGQAGAPLVAEMALSGAFDAKNTLDYLERKQRIEGARRQAAWAVAEKGRVRACRPCRVQASEASRRHSSSLRWRSSGSRAARTSADNPRQMAAWRRAGRPPSTATDSGRWPLGMDTSVRMRR